MEGGERRGEQGEEEEERGEVGEETIVLVGLERDSGRTKVSVWCPRYTFLSV